jgi:hypothetical protein
VASLTPALQASRSVVFSQAVGLTQRRAAGVLQITSGNTAAYTGTLSVDAGSVRLATGRRFRQHRGQQRCDAVFRQRLEVMAAAASITVNSGGTLTPGENVVTRNAGGDRLRCVQRSPMTRRSMPAAAYRPGRRQSHRLRSDLDSGWDDHLRWCPDDQHGLHADDLFGTTAPYVSPMVIQWTLFSLGQWFCGQTSQASTMTGTYGNVNFTEIDADRCLQTSDYLGNGQQFNFITTTGASECWPARSTLFLSRPRSCLRRHRHRDVRLEHADASSGQGPAAGHRVMRSPELAGLRPKSQHEPRQREPLSRFCFTTHASSRGTNTIRPITAAVIAASNTAPLAISSASRKRGCRRLPGARASDSMAVLKISAMSTRPIAKARRPHSHGRQRGKTPRRPRRLPPMNQSAQRSLTGF